MTIDPQPFMSIAEPIQEWPATIPISTEQYRAMVERGDFEKVVGQVELIHGRIVHMNPQGPQHCDPIDCLTEWSIHRSLGSFTIRVEKPIQIPDRYSCPEPDVSWVTRRRYADRHPIPDEVHLLIEVSYSSSNFDGTEKLQLYASAKIGEYWRVDVPLQAVFIHRAPVDVNYTSVERFDKGQTIHPLCMPEASLDIASLFAEQPAS
jgi:Uma2 family endonuclease